MKKLKPKKPRSSHKIAEKYVDFYQKLNRPSCFGKHTRHAIYECIGLYFKKSTVDKKVLPCRFYYQCVDQAIQARNQYVRGETNAAGEPYKETEIDQREIPQDP